MSAEKNKIEFEKWLSKSVAKDEVGRTDILNIVEQLLPWFIREHVDSEFNILYDYEDPEYVHSLWQAIKTTPELKNLNNNLIGERKYTEVIRLYENYLHDKKSRQSSVVSQESTDNFDNSELTSKDYTDNLLSEGELREKHLTYHERNPKLREQCIDIYGWKCKACGFDFEKVYGVLGKEYIEVHHLFPISQTEGCHEVDPTKDLVPLCANCHAMIHRLTGEEMTIDSLKKFLRHNS